MLPPKRLTIVSPSVDGSNAADSELSAPIFLLLVIPHVHLLVDIHPALDISVLINNLKTASARRARNRFAEHLAVFYQKPLFWHRAYFVGSVGGATLETVRAYVDAQGTEEHARKAVAKTKAKSKPPA